MNTIQYGYIYIYSFIGVIVLYYICYGFFQIMVEGYFGLVVFLKGEGFDQFSLGKILYFLYRAMEPYHDAIVRHFMIS